MELTEEQKQEIKQGFRERQKKQYIVSIPIIVLIFTFVIMEKTIRRGEFFGLSEEATGIGFIIIVIVALIFSYKNWRCPSCNKYLGKNINPQYCARCGVELR